MNKEFVGNVMVGGVFEYNGGLFAVMPFDWNEMRYTNLCIATRNHCDYDMGETYFFREDLEVTPIDRAELKKFIPKKDYEMR